MGTGMWKIPDLSKPIAKDSFLNRMIERVIWTMLSVFLLRYGYVVTDGFVQEAERASVKTIQLDAERSAFGAYIETRLKADKALEPALIQCLAEHEAADVLPAEGGYQP